MTPKMSLFLGLLVSAILNAGIAMLKPEWQPAAIAVAGVVLGALGVKRPGDASPAQVHAATISGEPGPPMAAVDVTTKKVTLL